jgi:hypothetical protein
MVWPKNYGMKQVIVGYFSLSGEKLPGSFSCASPNSASGQLKQGSSRNKALF